MKTPVIAALSIFLLVFSDQATAQTKMHLELGGGYASNTLSTGLLRNWEGGWLAGLTASYQFSEYGQLFGNANYHRLSYEGHNLQLAAPDEVGFRRKIDGDDTHVYELSFGARFVDYRKVKVLFSIRSGLVWMDVGSIRITEWNENRPDKRSTHNYSDSGELHRKGFASIGSGLMVPIAGGLNLVIEGSLMSTFDREEVIVPLTASMQIGL